MVRHMIASAADDPAGASPTPTAQTTASRGRFTALPTEQEVLDQCTPRLNRLAARLSHGNPHLGQDLFQEGAAGLVCAARRFDLRRGTKFSTLAYRHMRGRMLNFLRLERHHRYCISMQEASWQPDADGQREDDCLPVTQAEIEHLLAAFLFQVELLFLREPLRLLQSSFTPKQRQILNLRCRDGLAPSEIAAGLSVSPARVTRVLSEAGAKFQKAFLHN
jgi:RNA polymerase sigma factor (sigma-70 family)